MDKPVLYRKRLIPNECIELKDDKIVYQDEEYLFTSWKTLKPKPNMSHGVSCYLLNKGIKVSKFYRSDNTLLYWYCDIISKEYIEQENCYIFTDLLVDVIIYPSGFVKVMDLDELTEALEKDLMTIDQLKLSLRLLNDLLTCIYNDKFDRIQSWIDEKEYSIL